MRRREFLGRTAAGAGALALGAGFWQRALVAEARAAESSYGPLGAADANGFRLPPGFSSRQIARANEVVPGTTYRWHIYPDGQATYPAPDGGWVLVSNSESGAESGGGSSAIRFDAGGTVTGAHRILSGTNVNCAGGATPWGTWLSCEEYDGGHVWECDPFTAGTGVIRPALGTFSHEAAAVDPVARRVYMTEDVPDGGLYRFTPDAYPSLESGLLEVAVGAGDTLGWAQVPDPAGLDKPTREQVEGMRRFDGGEGVWFDGGTVYFSTKGTDQVWAYDTADGRIETIYDRGADDVISVLSGVDNLTVTSAGEVFVCEDGGDMEVCVIAPDRSVAPFLQLTGEAGGGQNELAGVVLDPSGTRMYLAAQRAFGVGAVYEIAGPFLAAEAEPAPTPKPTADPTPEPTLAPEGDSAAPAVAGPLPPGDADAPGLRLRAPRRVTVEALRRGKLLVRVELERPAEVTVALRTDALAMVPGHRGSSKRPKQVTLARRRRRRRSAGAAVALRLAVGPAVAKRLRSRRATPARLTVVARHGDGSVLVATRSVRIVSRRSR